MKHNLEESIKESLSNYELPYDAAAWSAMSKALDQKMPVTGKPSNLKWYLGGAAVVAIVAGSVFFLNSPDQTSAEKDQTVISQKGTSQNEDGTVSEGIPTGSQSITTNDHDNTTDNNTLIEAGQNNMNTESGDANSPSSSSADNSVATGNDNNKQDANRGNAGSDRDQTDPVTAKPIVFPAIAAACVNEKVEIRNENDVRILVMDPNGITTPVKPNTTLSLKVTLEGTYILGYYENGSFVGKEEFIVKPAPKAQFEFSGDEKFKNGVPTTTFNATVAGSEFVWNIKGEGLNTTLSGKETEAHFFNKGNYSVTLTVTGTNGCSASETNTVKIEEDYNLLAVNTFWPQSTDSKKNTFMPFGLKERNADFHMMIIDPSTGATVFETSDATEGWTGVDKRNGQLVDAQKTFIWIVRINNPMKGENPEYKGTIIRL